MASLTENLTALAKLRASGHLTPAEYERAKARFIRAFLDAVPAPTAAARPTPAVVARPAPPRPLPVKRPTTTLAVPLVLGIGAGLAAGEVIDAAGQANGVDIGGGLLG